MGVKVKGVIWLIQNQVVFAIFQQVYHFPLPLGLIISCHPHQNEKFCMPSVFKLKAGIKLGSMIKYKHISLLISVFILQAIVGFLLRRFPGL